MLEAKLIPVEVNSLTLNKLTKSAMAEGISVEKKIESILNFWIPVEEFLIPLEISAEIRTLKEAFGDLARENQELKDALFQKDLQKREEEVKSHQGKIDLSTVSEYTKTEFLEANPSYRK